MRNACLVFVVLCVVSSYAQTPRVERQKEFGASLPAVKAALQNLGAYTGSRLPSLEGFVNLEGIHAGDFQRPYFEYKIDLDPSTTKGTLVKVRANVSAWYPGQNGEAAGYRNFESTGRLETDLLDRLSQYLVDKSDDPKVLTDNIEKVRAQRAEAERQIEALGHEDKDARPAGIREGTQFALVSQAHVAICSSPSDNAKALVHPHLDDEFQILEQRGAWLRVALDSGASGCVKKTQVEISVATRVGKDEQAVKAAPGFSIIRQNEDEFAGDWQKLKGKRARYLFAQPDGSAMNVAIGDRWQFVQSVFSEQYRQISHTTTQNSIEGLVIIFMDQGGGVAAATFDDIRAWMEGTLTKTEFIKKCSLDPPSAFATSPPMTHPAGKRHSSLRSATTLPRS